MSLAPLSDDRLRAGAIPVDYFAGKRLERNCTEYDQRVDPIFLSRAQLPGLKCPPDLEMKVRIVRARIAGGSGLPDNRPWL